MTELAQTKTNNDLTCQDAICIMFIMESSRNSTVFFGPTISIPGKKSHQQQMPLSKVNHQQARVRGNGHSLGCVSDAVKLIQQNKNRGSSQKEHLVLDGV